jgi:hypothetical protein
VYLGKGSSPADLGKDAFWTWRYLGKGITQHVLEKILHVLEKA